MSEVLPPTPGSMRERVPLLNLQSLEALRGILAVYVMLGHVRWLLWDGHWQWTQATHPWWANALAYASAGLRYGHEAVICFFVLSGFFIHYRWADANAAGRTPEFALDGYARRRMHRLFPPYALALLATVCLDVLGWTMFPSLYSASTGVENVDQAFSRMQFTEGSVIAALLMLPSSTGTHFGSNGPLWSLAYEFVYYALYPLLVPLRERLGRWAFLVAAGLSCGLALVIPNPFVSSVLLMYPLWLLGAAMAERMLSGASPPPKGALVIGLLAGFVGFHWMKGALSVFPYVLFGFAVVYLAATLSARVENLPAHRIAQWFGVRSYTIYICHFPFVALVSAVVFETLGRRPSSGWIAIAGAVGALMWCWMLWWLVERRFTHEKLALPSAVHPR